METHSLAAAPEEPAAGWALLVIPGIGAFMTALLLGAIMSDDSLWSRVILLVPWPASAWGRVVSQVVRLMVAYLPILIVSGGLALLTNWIPLLQPIAQNVRRDWSLLSFLLYGIAPLSILLHDEYRGLGTYQLASLAIFVGGALAYLRPTRPWPRYLTLVGALGLSLGLLGLGIYRLYPQQAWAASTRFPRWWEAINPLIQGVALAMLMVAPALLMTLPLGKNKLAGAQR